jgi:hypothetical protein
MCEVHGGELLIPSFIRPGTIGANKELPLIIIRHRFQ